MNPPGDSLNVSRFILHLSMMGFATALSARALDPLVPTVASDLAVDAAWVALLSTAFALPFALVQPVLGGIAERLARELGERTGKEARAMVLGHLQRGGGPTNFDRLLSLRFGAAAVRYLADDCSSGMVALRNHQVGFVSLDEVTSRIKTVPLDCDTILTGREMGLCFGDEGPGAFHPDAAPSR